MELKNALLIADQVVEVLSPYCELINVAGSCRRLKPYVKDIEVVCLPKRETYIDLLSGERRKLNRTKKFFDAATTLGKILKGSFSDGKYVQIDLKQGIKLDLFMPVEQNYYRILAIRTGSADYSHRVIAEAWYKLGWCGVDGELRKIRDCIRVGDKWKCSNPNPELPPVWTSEQDFFDWLKIECIEPQQREV